MRDEDTDGESDRAAAEEEPDESTEEFESERTATRAEAAAVLRGLADGVDAGAVAIGSGEDAVTATVPDEFDFELEYETDGDEAEIEVELEWVREDEPPMSEVVPGDTSAETAGSDDGGEPEADVSGSANDGDEPSDAEAGESEQPATETATVEAAADAGETSSESGSDEQTIVEPVAPLSSQARFEVFRDRADEWRWRLVHRNGNVIATSGEGYTRRHNAEKGLRSVVRNAPDADVVEDDR
ncbi:HVO_2922 family protein [Halosimplex sp. J119]